jgi:formiminoglutamase
MKNRQQESISPLLNWVTSSLPYSNLILSSPSDIGVRRNGGRNGARFAPKGILNVLKKMNKHDFQNRIDIVDVTDQSEELKDFEDSQLKSAKKIENEININKQNKIIHIGGGHDHAYPLLKALDNSPQFENILILNIDAHCDTRIDDKHHSGTPFRDFDNDSTKPFHLIQYGIHSFANSKSTFTPLKNGTSETIMLRDILNSKNTPLELLKSLMEKCPFEITEKTALYFSLDCDAICGEQMKAVSAVNPMGLPLLHVDTLLDKFKTKTSGKTIFGLYEYNPVYEDLSQLGSRGLSHLIYNFLN